MNGHRRRRSVAWELLAVVTAVAGLALLVASVRDARADDPDPTVVEWRGSGAPWGPYTQWRTATLAPAGVEREATLIVNAQADYLWVRYRSGPQACVFTASAADVGQSVGGGRECDMGHDGSCGYYMRGFGAVYGASGKACAGYGIADCTGICR